MKVTIETDYGATWRETIDLPEGKTWDDVKEIYVKWGHGTIEFNDGHIAEFDMDVDAIVEHFKSELKWPYRTVVYAEDGDIILHEQND